MSSRSKIIQTPRPQELATMTPQQIRDAFVVAPMPCSGRVSFSFTNLDRLALALVETREPTELVNDRETGSDFFLQRRELGALNIGTAAGVVHVDGQRYEIRPEDCIYIGVGSKSVTFESAAGGAAAKFFLISCPAHQSYPTAVASKAKANAVALGSAATANQRRIYQYIHTGGIRSCQLVMGYTDLAEGSVWNTMPPHTHTRRTEIYFYFDLGENIVAHFLGAPDATRHVFVQNEQAVLSPPWSIHCGCGTARYKFIWAMAGENQTFDDMDKVAAVDLR